MSVLAPALTHEGKTLLAGAIAGNGKITFTKMAIGDGERKNANSSEIGNPIVTVNFDSIIKSDDYVTLRGSFDNSDLKNGFYMTEIGVYASDESNEEVLFAYTHDSTSSDYITVTSYKIVTTELSIVVAIGDAKDVAISFIDSTAQENIQFTEPSKPVDLKSGDTVAELFGKISTWIKDTKSNFNDVVKKMDLLESNITNTDKEIDGFLDRVYPIGAVYISVSNIDPGKLFGGKWSRIQERFLLSAGKNYAAGASGGEAFHTLTTEEMPKHTHEQRPHTHEQRPHNHDQNEHSHDFSATTSTSTHTHTVKGYGKTLGSGSEGWRFGEGGSRTAAGLVNSNSHSHTVSGKTGGATATNKEVTAVNEKTTAENESAGRGEAHNNMPPYYVVHMWKRVA